MKKVHLTQSEIDNACKSYGGRWYTVIRRPQSNGKIWVASINLETRQIITEEFVDTRDEVPNAIREVNRGMDKYFGGGKMSHVSRRRKWRKQQA